ncbi:hypothetical protein GLAREA_11333 [Glarea lozoyensis ATCC 20868]|uniref:Metalloproteases (Zincins), catalytic n=1 Tax=Glarea lozoyensis (strain ATCC 20868 / MF5171) TaxID=1116229 RepID=S3EBE3_GLAL2|nr:uncharacterized protein GLAREA_11333 [Glarea lozoyensis ATCC 20868]EPE35633.1 hypothetical protein GLAREA_11333 [Glarea lozoyensis ATCC 20868]
MLSILLLLPSASAIALPTSLPTATDIPSSLNDSTFDPSYYLDGYEGCDGPQELAIKDAFTEAIQLIGGTEVPVDATGSMITEYPAFEWTSAGAIEYFGPAERTEEYRYTVKGNLDRAAKVQHTWRWLPPWSKKMSVSCNDPEQRCPVCQEPGTVSKVYAYNIDFEAHVNFCPRFFGLSTLQGKMNEMAVKPLREQGYVYSYINRGLVWAHELLHIDAIGKGTGFDHVWDVPVPYYHPDVPYDPVNGILQTAYGPLFTKWLAQSDLVQDFYASSNAENYAMFFMANFVNRKRKFYPSLPQVAINPFREPKDGDYTGVPPKEEPSEQVAGCVPPKFKVPILAQTTITPTGPTMSPTSPPTDLPKLTSQAYCTETLQDGKLIFHEKTVDPCPSAQPTPPPPPPTPAPITKRLFVMYEEYMDQILAENHWDFFTRPGDNNDKWDPCKSKPTLEEKKAPDGDIESPPTPNGSWTMKLFDVSDCVYSNDGNSMGTLNCPGMATPVTCVKEEVAPTIPCANGNYLCFQKEVRLCGVSQSSSPPQVAKMIFRQKRESCKLMKEYLKSIMLKLLSNWTPQKGEKVAEGGE